MPHKGVRVNDSLSYNSAFILRFVPSYTQETYKMAFFGSCFSFVGYGVQCSSDGD